MAFDVRAPGRVNLIGEHVDYSEGFVLPAAVDLALALSGEPRGDGAVLLRSAAYDGEAFIPPGADPAAVRPRWAAPAAALMAILAGRGLPAGGFQADVSGDLPAGAGLSSSAAFLVAVGLAARAAAGAPAPDDAERMALALAGRDAEERARGVRCGIMDPVASLLSREGSALLLDCRARTWRRIPVPAGRLALIVADSGVAHDLAAGEYNLRHAECREAAERLGLRTLRDLDPAGLDGAARVLPPVLFRRARHVATENERTLAAARALETGAVAEFGRLLAASHESLRLDFGVSTPELDALVAVAGAAPGVLGARLVGGGFGGSVLVAVDPMHRDAAIEDIGRRYRPPGGGVAVVRPVRPGPGASVS